MRAKNESLMRVWPCAYPKCRTKRSQLFLFCSVVVLKLYFMIIKRSSWRRENQRRRRQSNLNHGAYIHILKLHRRWSSISKTTVGIDNQYARQFIDRVQSLKSDDNCCLFELYWRHTSFMTHHCSLIFPIRTSVAPICWVIPPASPSFAGYQLYVFV